MLDYIRQRSQGWLAWGIVLLIIIPFALWGINQYTTAKPQNDAATVNDVGISKQSLEQAYYRQRARLQQMFGENFRPDMFPEDALKRQLLDGLVSQEVIRQAARERHMAVGDQLLIQTIASIPSFQVDGQFSDAAYARVLAAQGMQPGYFEYQVRRDLLNEQYSKGISGSDFALPGEAQVALELQNAQRDVGWMRLPIERFEAEANVSEEEVTAHYEANKPSYMLPERVRVAYIDLSVAGLAEGIEVDDTELKARYESQSSNYVAPEQRHARHILIKVAKDADDETKAQALAKANELRGRILAGEALTDLAAEFSDDPGSKNAGGDLGFFTKDQMVGPFSAATFAMQPGELSEPVLTDFGYHLIELVAIAEEHTKPFEEVRETLAKEMREHMATERFDDLAEKLRTLSYEHPDTLQVAAEELGLPVKESQPFPRQGAGGLFSNPKVTAAAFSEEVMARGMNSEALEVTDTRLVVLRNLEILPEELRPLDQVRGEIESQLKRGKARDLAKAKADALVEKLNAGDAPEALAEAEGLEWVHNSAQSRSSAGADGELVTALFGMPRPVEGKPSIERVALANGDQAVVALFATLPVAEETDSAKLDAERTQLANANGMAATDEVTSYLEGVAKVKYLVGQTQE